MKFQPTPLSGVFVVQVEPVEDERGFFARTWCADELAAGGLDAQLSQCSVSWNRLRGTLRGMHWQAAPWEESKLVRCTRGRIYDVVLDLRAASPTKRQWFAIELSAANRDALYVPAGVAHGFQTQEDDCEVSYMISQRYEPIAASGVRWNDPAFGIAWPLGNPVLSDRDAAYPDYRD